MVIDISHLSKTLLDMEPSECNFEDYDFRIFDSVQDMIFALSRRKR